MCKCVCGGGGGGVCGCVRVCERESLNRFFLLGQMDIKVEYNTKVGRN